MVSHNKKRKASIIIKKSEDNLILRLLRLFLGSETEQKMNIIKHVTNSASVKRKKRTRKQEETNRKRTW